MAPSPSSPATTAHAGAPPHVLLDSLVDLALAHLNGELGGFSQRVLAALLDADGVGETRALTLRLQAGTLLQANAYAFFHLASSGFERALRAQAAQLAPRARAPASGATLALVPLEEMEARLVFDKLSRPLELRYAEPLATLNVRLGFLLGSAILRTPQNPFRPELLISVLNQAWCDFQPDPATHALILPLLRPPLLFDLLPLYEALNLALQSRGVLPGPVDARRLRKADGVAAGRAARAANDAALARQLRQFLAHDTDLGVAFDPSIPLLPELDAPAQAAGSWRPSAAQAERSAQPARVPLLAMLAGMAHGMAEQGAAPNVFYLPQLKRSVPPGSLTRADESTIDLLAAIFESVLQDAAIGPEVRELIRFLQVPVLKAALRDQDFFFEQAHPARRMLDLLARLGWEQRQGAHDPVWKAMRRSVERVGRSEGQDAGGFPEAVAELEASIEAEDGVAQQAMAAPIAAALRQERRAAAAAAARDALAVRLGTGELVALVETFLEDKWSTVLTLAYSVEQDQPGALASATRTMDELIWSVRPKASQEQRKELIARLPGLLSKLNKWLDVIGWNDGERLQFFAGLAECHAGIVRAPLEIAPARQLELALEAAQQDALRRVAREQALAAAAQPGPDAAVITVDALERGMWLEFGAAGATPRKLRLAWVSPLRSLFIFSTGSRQEAFSISADKLAEAVRGATVRVIGSDGLVGRALSQAMQQAASA